MPYFGLFSRRSPALELRFRVETTVMQHTHDIASDVNFEFSETIYTTFENYMKFPLRELYLPDPPSKVRGGRGRGRGGKRGNLWIWSFFLFLLLFLD